MFTLGNCTEFEIIHLDSAFKHIFTDEKQQYKTYIWTPEEDAKL